MAIFNSYVKLPEGKSSIYTGALQFSIATVDCRRVFPMVIFQTLPQNCWGIDAIPQESKVYPKVEGDTYIYNIYIYNIHI